MSSESKYTQYEIKEGIVFLVELTDAIYAPTHSLNGHSQLFEILSCINDLLSDMIIAFPSNGVGIYFYNCAITGSKFKKNSSINKIFSLNDLNSSNMKVLNNVVNDELDQFKPLKRRFPVASESQDNLHTVLETVLNAFQNRPQYNRRKLFWFTNNDRPYSHDNMKDSLRTLVSDFEVERIIIDPYFLDTFEDELQTKIRPFDMSQYQNFFLNTNFLKDSYDDEDDILNASTSRRSPMPQKTVSTEIRRAIFRLKEVRRVQFTCDLILSDGPKLEGSFGCSIRGYTLYNHEKVKHIKNVYTESDSMKIVHSNSTPMRTDRNEEISIDGSLKSQLLHGIPVKDEGELSERVILLNSDNYKFMKSYAFDHNAKDNSSVAEIASPKLGDLSGDEDEIPVPFTSAPYLKLLCFREISSYQPFFCIKTPLFVTADLNDGLNSTNREGGYSKSFKTFRALYRSCVKLQRMAIVFGCPKRTSTPALHVLYPTNTTGMQPPKGKTMPDGFLLIQLPWLSELRSLPDYILNENAIQPGREDSVDAPRELTSMFEKLLAQFDNWSTYDPSCHENPTLQYFYRTIKQEILQIDIKAEDHSLAGNDWSAERLCAIRSQVERHSDVAESFKITNQAITQISNSEFLKRKAEENSSPSKKSKIDTLDEAAIVTLWKNDTWNNVTVAQLREFIARYDNIKNATKKADMIANISGFLESRKRT